MSKMINLMQRWWDELDVLDMTDAEKVEELEDYGDELSIKLSKSQVEFEEKVRLRFVESSSSFIQKQLNKRFIDREVERMRRSGKAMPQGGGNQKQQLSRFERFANNNNSNDVDPFSYDQQHQQRAEVDPFFYDQ